DRPQVRLLVHLRRRSARPGQGECPPLPEGQSRARGGDREQDQGQTRHWCSARGGRGRPGRSSRLLILLAAPTGVAAPRLMPSAPHRWVCATALRQGAAGRNAAVTRGSQGEEMSRTRSGRFDPDEPPATGAAGQDKGPDPDSVARAIALRKLGAAPQSRAQLAEAMASKNVPEEIAENVLDRFEDVNLIDDAAYAEMLVRTRHNERGLARRALAHELWRKGVDAETAEA